MGTWNDIWMSLKRSNNIKKKNPGYWKSQQEMPWNIYEPGMKLGDHVRKFHWIHWVFKTKILVPCVYLLEKLLHKHVEKSIPDAWHNRNFKVFDKAFDKALSDFYVYYIAHMRGQETYNLSAKGLDDVRKVGEKILPTLANVKVLNGLRRIMYTMTLNDTAYREFFNMLMYNIFIEMRDEYKGIEKHQHLVYGSTNMFHVEYFLIGKRLFDTGELPKGVEKVGK